jgi:hypothetical protein
MAGSFDLDAVIKPRTRSVYLDLNVSIQDQDVLTRSVYLDSNVVAEGGGFTLNAWLVGEYVRITDAFDVNATLFKTTPGSFGIDALLSRLETGSFSIDAVLDGPVTGDLFADAIFRVPTDGSFSIDALTTPAPVTETGDFDLLAVLRATQSSLFTTDAIFQASTQGQFGLAASVVVSVTSSFAIDSVVGTTTRWTFAVSLNAFIEFATVSNSMALDAYFTTDSTQHSRLHDHFGSQPIDVVTYNDVPISMVLGALYGSLDDIARPHFSVEAYIRPYIALNAVLTAQGSSAFDVNAWIGGWSMSVDAVIQRVYRINVGINAYIVSP